VGLYTLYTFNLRQFQEVKEARGEAGITLSFSQYCLYYSDLWFTRTSQPRVKFLLMAVAALILVGSIFFNAVTHRGFVQSVWAVWTFAADPGARPITPIDPAGALIKSDHPRDACIRGRLW
jgi:hypothetical protein